MSLEDCSLTLLYIISVIGDFSLVISGVIFIVFRPLITLVVYESMDL